jgi:Glycosyl transferases group 1
MSLTERREPRERPDRPANRNHNHCAHHHPEQTAIDPCPLTTAPPYGRRTATRWTTGVGHGRVSTGRRCNPVRGPSRTPSRVLRVAGGDRGDENSKDQASGRGLLLASEEEERPLSEDGAATLVRLVSQRDYATLIEAVRDLPVDVEIAAGTITLPNVHDLSGTVDSDIAGGTGKLPSNVRVGSYKHPELRELYARSRFVVVPVQAVDFDAGVTAISEAMAMGKAVITTRAVGLTSLFQDGEAGIFVEAGDVAAWRAAVNYLLDHPDQAARMGQAGRECIERVHGLDDAMVRLAEVICA